MLKAIRKTYSHAMNVALSKLHEAKKQATRSPEWRKVERAHLETFSSCLACGGFDHLQVHHVKPFHLYPELELDPGNLVTLCMGARECHLQIGHGGDFRKYNPAVLAMAALARQNPDQFELFASQSHKEALL